MENTFARLAAINVGPHIEKKNNLSYLSWAWAWDQIMRQDPAASYAYGEPKIFGGETVMVYCTVTAFGVERTAHLPVMDHRNKPIPTPDAFAMNTAMQRCLVKAIALHGLGLYIYAGEDLPLGEEAAKADAPTAPAGFDAFLLDLEAVAANGFAALAAAFKAASPAFQEHAKTRQVEINGLKAKAKAADAKGGGQ